MNDLSTDWYGIISGGKRQVPLLVMDGVVYGEALSMILALMERFPEFDVTAEEEKMVRNYIDIAIKMKPHNDALLKHFGFCMIAEGAKDYRNKGAQTGEGLQWVQTHLDNVNIVF